MVTEWYSLVEEDQFLQQPFSNDEIIIGVKSLKKGKAAGCDSLTTEHLVHAGHGVIDLLTLIFNSIINLEFVPTNSRRGTMIPLYKGKNTCPLDVNNY